VPRRTPEEYLAIAEKLRGKDIDVLLLHETPCLLELFPFMRIDYCCETALRAIKIIKPNWLLTVICIQVVIRAIDFLGEQSTSISTAVSRTNIT